MFFLRAHMTIIIVDPSDRKSAVAISEVTFKRTGVRESIVQLNATLEGELNEITLLAHTDSEGANLIGEQTPEAMARKFKSMFGRHDKTQLRDLYLIACEAGFAIDGRPSLAQRMAKEMSTLGFTNVKVHAVANPAGFSPTGMTVEVIHRPGCDTGRTEGQVNAHFSYGYTKYKGEDCRGQD